MLIEGKIIFPLKIKKSRIHGKGAYAYKEIPAHRKIGSLSGKIISIKEARKKAKTKISISIVELWNGRALDASSDKALRFINHSCGPNTYMRTFNHHVEFYALRKVLPGEELSCNYGITHHEGTRKCNCGAANCKGFI